MQIERTTLWMSLVGLVIGTCAVAADVDVVSMPGAAHVVTATGPPAALVPTASHPRGVPATLAAMSSTAALSAAVFTTTGGPATHADEARFLGDWDGREDIVADHEGLAVDNSSAGNAISEYFTRTGVSVTSRANGASGFNASYYVGDSVGNVVAHVGLSTGLTSSISFTINVPQLVATGASNGSSLVNTRPGDLTSGSVIVTGIAVNPIAQLGGIDPVALCNTIGEVIYFSVYDPTGGSLDDQGLPIRTRIFAWSMYSGDDPGGEFIAYTNVVQLFQSHLGNLAGVAVDDEGSLYFQLADLQDGSGAAIFKATEQPRTICAQSNRIDRLVPAFLDVTLDLDTTAVDGAGGAHITNYSGTAATFGNVMAMAGGPGNVLYAAVARSKSAGDDAGTQATEGPFTNPDALGPTPSMVISLADGSGAVDACSSPAPSQPGILPIGDGIADIARAGLALTPGIDNFRVFALGTGPDRRSDGDPVFGGPSNTQKLEFQIDPTIFSGITVDEENAVYVISGGTPAGEGTNPSPSFGEILKFPDRKPFDRRADFIDLRGDGISFELAVGGNTGDGDSDHFDHLFWPAPLDAGNPRGLAGLSHGHLYYLLRNVKTPIGGLPEGHNQGDDDTTGPIDFNAFDPSGQVAGGDDASAPSTGDDAGGGFEFSFGGIAAGACTAPWTAFYLNANGNLTFGAGDMDRSPTVPELLSGAPRIAPAWFDVLPSSRDQGAVNTFPLQALGFAGPNAFKVRWIGVPEFGFEACGSSNTFSVTLYDDGTGIDESSTADAEGPTDQRFVNGVGAPPRTDGEAAFAFDYGRMDLIGEPGEPILVGYSQGGQDPAFPNACETDWSRAAAASDLSNGAVGDGSKRMLYELFSEGQRPLPAQPGAVTFDLRFESNDAALTTAAGQLQPNRGTVVTEGPNCSPAGTLACACEVTIDPLTLPGGAAFDTQIMAEGGRAPHTYAVTSGSLPAGVTLASSGLLAGASASSGPFAFEVTSTDALACTGRRAYSVTATCAVSATFPSLGCRVDVLLGNVDGVPDGKIKKKLRKLLTSSKSALAKAETRRGGGTPGPVKKLLARAAKSLKKFARTVASRGAKKQLSDETRSTFTNEGNGIRTDVLALRESS